MKRNYVIFWCLWIGAFVVIETMALLDRSPNGDTLSELIWTAVEIPVVWWVVAAFLIWLVIHFLFRGKYDDPRKWFRSRDAD